MSRSCPAAAASSDCRRLLTRSPFVVNDFELCTLFRTRRRRRLPLCVLVLAFAVTLNLWGAWEVSTFSAVAGTQARTMFCRQTFLLVKIRYRV
jgi:hypothetical protein